MSSKGKKPTILASPSYATLLNNKEGIRPLHHLLKAAPAGSSSGVGGPRLLSAAGGKEGSGTYTVNQKNARVIGVQLYP